MNQNFEFLKKFGNISEQSFKKLQKLTTLRKVPANTVLCKSGTIPKYIYMLVSGVINAFVTSESGKYFNKRLYTPISFAGALTSMLKNEPSEVTYTSLTECKFFELNFEEFKRLCREEFEIGRLYVKVLEHAFIAYEERNLDLMRLDATQRYLKLRDEVSNIDDLIPQYQIASYLNITPVQLSRIRKKIGFI
jgi:CRP-like cAMP-binding protein